jgi:hypothetical protein
MIAHVCVAIQLLGAPPVPGASQALQQRCDSILGAGECRLTQDQASACWLATVVRTEDDAVATIVVSGPGAAAERVAQRDLTFQASDELSDRWETMGLVVAALVTREVNTTEVAPTPVTATATAPAATPPRPHAAWFSRDRSTPATISEQPEESSDTPLQLADVRLLGVADMGRLPWATVGARLGATVGLVRHLDLEIGGAYLTSTSTAAIPIAGGGTGGAHFKLWSMSVGVCPQSRVNARLTGHVCLGGDVGVTTATGTGIANPVQGSVLVPNAWFGFDSAFRVTRHLALVAEYKTEVAALRPAFAVNGGTLFQASRVSESVALGIAGTF